MHTPWNLLNLEELGALRARGRDVVPFLQGQLSADLAHLTADRSLLAGHHNPQGRVLAVLRLIELAPGEVLAILPRELAATTARRLASYILRAKVELADESANWRIEGLVSAAAPAPASDLPAAPGGVARRGHSLAVRVGEHPARWLIISPSAPAAPEPHFDLSACAIAAPQLWRRLALANGEPQVYAATSGEFVAQMLNLDVLGAVDFDKGCYTGQEVIARAHYRGRVKRRLQRFRSTGPLALQPGDAGELADGRTLRVVDAAQLADGSCEFLAVAPLVTNGASAGGAPAAAAAPRLQVAQLPLPYALPG
jgi:tRNA-modifying protein YgfZ